MEIVQKKERGLYPIESKVLNQRIKSYLAQQKKSRPGR